MSYERITERVGEGGGEFVRYKYGADKTLSQCLVNILGRLAELEDKIESGQAVILPCKENDPVYQIEWNREACYDCDYDCRGHKYSSFSGNDDSFDRNDNCHKHFLEINEYKFNLRYFVMNKHRFGKSIFLTPEEAEAKLEELKNK